MKDKIVIEPVNEVYVRIKGEPYIIQELKQRFTFKAPNYKFHPSYRAGYWNGDICLYNGKTKQLYKGLIGVVKQFCEENDYEYEIDPSLEITYNFSLKEVEDFIKKLGLPEKIESRDYQIETIAHCIRNSRALFISPTASGKSFIIYSLIRFYTSDKSKTLIIVDSINLLNQMYSDFEEYGFNSEKFIHRIKGGTDKESKKPIFVSTWQSATKMSEKWFNQFDCIIVDEAHRAKATSVKKILENSPNCKIRFGFTGSLDGSETNQLVLEGLLGPYKKIVSTKELMDQNFLAELKLKLIQLVYTDEEKKDSKRLDYQGEIDFLYKHRKRNIFIRNLALSLKGNTLVLFQRLDHGKELFELINKDTAHPVYYVAGSVDGEEREEIRKIVNTHEHSITVASVGTFSTGVNIPNINNIIIASPTKSQIRTLQTIGRGLRKSDKKNSVIVFDIADDLSWKKRQNYTLKHFMERLVIYAKEQFVYKLYKVELK